MAERKRHGGKQKAWPGHGPEAAVVEESGRAGKEAWSRPWVPWAVGPGLLLLGAAVGWGSSYLALGPLLGQPAGTSRPAGRSAPAGDGAQVEAIVPPTMAAATAAPGDQVTLIWQVRNTGGTAWGADSHRFAPQDAGTPVIPLPHTVKPGESATIQAVLTVPDTTGPWQPAWQLTGPKRPVPGGTLTTSLRIRVADVDPDPDSGGR